jgi:3-oxoacyl-[acyl-carrier-protein] synthase II
VYVSSKGVRVVVTGLGAITPIGTGVQSFWNNLLGGKSGISTISLFDASDLATRIAGEVRNFDPLDYMDKMDVRKYDRFTQFALVASQEAVRDAGIRIDALDPYRAGVIIGSGIGGLQTLLDQHDILRSRGPRRVSPFLIPAMIPNMASGVVSIKHGFRGPNMCTVSACASANHSIGEAQKYIQRGEADIMLCGGAEAPVVELGVAGFVSMKALSTRNDEPERASRPFDVDRDGFVIGEGAAVIILESEEHALKRGAKIYATLAGYGVSADAHHMAAPEPSGLGAKRCMENAIQDAGLSLTDIGYVNAHGTSTPPGDKSEVLALKNLFGEHIREVKISSNKSMIGHLLGAAGGAETLATVLTVNTGKVPPTINLDNPEFDLDFVPHRSVDVTIGAAINNSFGFGGHNASLVVTRYEE